MKSKPEDWYTNTVLLPWETLPVYEKGPYRFMWVRRNSTGEWGAAVYLLLSGAVEYVAIDLTGHWGEVENAINIEEAFLFAEKEAREIGWIICPAKMAIMI